MRLNLNIKKVNYKNSKKSFQTKEASLKTMNLAQKLQN